MYVVMNSFWCLLKVSSIYSRLTQAQHHSFDSIHFMSNQHHIHVVYQLQNCTVRFLQVGWYASASQIFYIPKPSLLFFRHVNHNAIQQYIL